MEYFGRLSIMWEELETYKLMIQCVCGANHEYEREREEAKIHQFMMGLDESRFSNVCTSIIDTDPLPDMSEVYCKVIREEHRLSLAKDRELQQNAVRFVAKREQVSDATSFNIKIDSSRNQDK